MSYKISSYIWPLNITAILKILLYTGIFSTLLPLVFFLLFKKNNKEKELRVILFYIIYCIINEALNYYLQSIKSSNVVLVFSSFTVIEYSFFCYFIFLILPKKLIKKSIPFIWIAFLLFAAIDFFYINKTEKFDSFASGIESIIIILLCIYYLFSQVKISSNLLLYSTFNFWVIIAFLIYFSGTFFLYIMTENMWEDKAFRKLYFVINISFNILKNILLCVAMCMKTNDSIKPTPSSLPDLGDEDFFHKNN